MLKLVFLNEELNREYTNLVSSVVNGTAESNNTGSKKSKNNKKGAKS